MSETSVNTSNITRHTKEWKGLGPYTNFEYTDFRNVFFKRLIGVGV
jgi:hypothetical protein